MQLLKSRMNDCSETHMACISQYQVAGWHPLSHCLCVYPGTHQTWMCACILERCSCCVYRRAQLSFFSVGSASDGIKGTVTADIWCDILCFWWLFQGNCQTEVALTGWFGSWCVLDENFFPPHICCCCLKMQPCLCLSAFIGFAANFRYRGVYPVWAGLTPSSAHSQGLCCVTRLLRRAKARQEKLKSWDEGVYLCADGSSPWWHFFQHFFLGLHRGFPWAWHPWRCASGGRKQAGHHTHFPPCWYHGMLQKSAEMGP